MVRLGVIGGVGTAGIYSGLYGFAAAERAFVVLGIVLAALAAAGLAMTVASGWRRRPIRVAGTAEVLTVSPPPESGEHGRAELSLVLAAPGLPAAEVRVSDPRAPVRSWPEPGDRLPVHVDVTNVRRTTVRWDDFHKPRPVADDFAADRVPAAEAVAGVAVDAGPPPAGGDFAVGSGPAVAGGDFAVGSGPAVAGGDFAADPVPSAECGDFAADPVPSAECGDRFAFDDLGPAPELTEEELHALRFDGAPHAGSRRVLPADDEPTYLVARYLYPTERFRGEWRRHLVRPAVRYVLTLGLAVAGEILVRRYVPDDYLTLARAGVAVLGGLIALHVLFAWHQGRFVLTDKRVLLVEGVLRRRVSMVPLARVADLRFEQSAPGRLLGYGMFVIEGMHWFSRIRRISSLPSPNELYLRMVEEVYEPAAVEARLGNSPFDPGSETPAELPSSPSAPPGYDGWVSVEVLDPGGDPVPITGDRHVRLEPGRAYELQVVIGPGQAADLTEPLVAGGGDFTVEVDSDRPTLRQAARTIPAGPDGGYVVFPIRAPADGLAGSPRLRVRIHQRHRLLRTIELTATAPVSPG